MPLTERYGDSHRFLGVVLKGVFTDDSLNQLRSLGLHVVYVPYESVGAAFAAVGIDAAFDEDTPAANLKRKAAHYANLKPAQRERTTAFLCDRHKTDLVAFIAALRTTPTGRIASVYVLALHGSPRTLGDVAEAIALIDAFDESKPCEPFMRHEVGVRYSNGDEIRGQFKDKATAVAFLRSMRQRTPQRQRIWHSFRAEDAGVR